MATLANFTVSGVNVLIAIGILVGIAAIFYFFRRG